MAKSEITAINAYLLIKMEAAVLSEGEPIEKAKFLMKSMAKALSIKFATVNALPVSDLSLYFCNPLRSVSLRILPIRHSRLWEDASSFSIRNTKRCSK
jgi:hypothetical protein